MESIEDEPFLKTLIKGIAAQFGPNCEVVLHDLRNKPYDSTIVAIENGHVTGRRIGDCGTNLGLQVLRGTDKKGDKYAYLNQTPTGKLLRSTSIYIRNQKGEAIGSVCINLDVTDLMMARRAISSLTGQSDEQEKDRGDTEAEVFPNDVGQLLQTLIQLAIRYVGKPVARMTKEDKMNGIKYLDDKGAFLIKKSADRIAKFFGVSKYTIYSYLEKTRSLE